MISFLRSRFRRLGDQSGFSLIEMIVVISILGAVLAMVQAMSLSAFKDVGSNATRLDQAQQARAGIESMSKVLRTAVLPRQLLGSCTLCDLSAFLQGTTNSVSFYANLNNLNNAIGPSKASYTVDPADPKGTLVEVIQPPDAHLATDTNYQYCVASAVTCTTDKTRVVAYGVTGLATLFTYYDKNGAVLTPPLDATELTQVDSMDIVLTVKRSTTVKGTTLTQRVTLPNADSVVDDSVTP
jgi:prepilin-type N-terminal cleavage/methylation domain-containing protein